MINNIEKIHNTIKLENPNQGFEKLSLESDIYTDFGRFLEKTQLVEAPQLLNIIGGSMSFVGNRPLPVHINKSLAHRYGNIVKQRTVCKPGIAGYVQLRGKHSMPDQKRLVLEKRLALSLVYGSIYNRLWVFMSLLVSVILSVLLGKVVFLGKTKTVKILLNSRGG